MILFILILYVFVNSKIYVFRYRKGNTTKFLSENAETTGGPLYGNQYNPYTFPTARRGMVSCPVWMNNQEVTVLFGGVYGNGKYGGDLYHYRYQSNEFMYIRGIKPKNSPVTLDTIGIFPGSASPPLSWIFGMIPIKPGSRAYGFMVPLKIQSDIVMIGYGYGHDFANNIGFLCDLWGYNVTNGTFAWIAGGKGKDVVGVYLSKDTAGGFPGPRRDMMVFPQPDGFLMFGGYGRDDSGDFSFLQDVYKFESNTLKWKWIGSSRVGNQIGSGNSPGGRINGASWSYSDGLPSNGPPSEHPMIFGGFGYAIDGNFGYLSDMWLFNTTSINEFSFLCGNDTANVTTNYDDYRLGGRFGALTWVAQVGPPGLPNIGGPPPLMRFFIFGGYGAMEGEGTGYFSDIWSFDFESFNFTFRGGSQDLDDSGSYGNIEEWDATNLPPARILSTFIQGMDKGLFFGGGFLSDDLSTYNDLWEIDFLEECNEKFGDQACGGHGVCVPPGVCNCSNPNLSGPNCNSFTCNDILATNTSFVCSNHGNCVGPDNCACYVAWGGDWCGFTPVCDKLAFNEDKVCNQSGVCSAPEMCRCVFARENQYCEKKKNITSLFETGNIDNNQTSLGNYLNIPSLPAGRMLHGMEKGSEDKILMYGGISELPNGNTSMGDIWSYELGSGNWTWIKGGRSSPGNLGVIGVYDDTSLPASRYNHIFGRISSDEIFIFGGIGNNSSPVYITLADAWTYGQACQTFVRVYGNLTQESDSICFKKSQFHKLNRPGSRHSASGIQWSDEKFIVFGGQYNTEHWYNSMFMFDLSSFNWSCVFHNADESLNTILNNVSGIGDFSNYSPGGRKNAIIGKINSDELLVFGGQGCSSGDCSDIYGYYLSDVWIWSFSRKKWKCLSGSNVGDNTRGISGDYSSVSLYSNSRVGYSAHYDPDSMEILFFGGLDGSNFCNDLWSFSLKRLIYSQGAYWMYIDGDCDNNVGHFVTNFQFHQNNTIGSRMYHRSVYMNANNIVIYGGLGIQKDFDVVLMDDVWAIGSPYTPPPPPIYTCFGVNMNDKSVCNFRNGTCTGNNICTCIGKWTGNQCQTPRCYGLEGSNACSSRGTCIGPDTCVCNSPYEGSKCENFRCQAILNTNNAGCSSHGVCIAPNVCNCTGGFYTGKYCDSFSCYGKDRNSIEVCNFQNGTCKGYDFCSCNPPYTGLKCEKYKCSGVDSEKLSVCSSGGNCIGPDICDCDSNHTGLNCEQSICFGMLHSDLSCCSGHGKCSNGICKCDFGYSGSQCEKAKCGLSTFTQTCHGHGTCTEYNKCTCNSNFAGDYCDKCKAGFDLSKDCATPLSTCDPILKCNGKGVCEGNNCKCFYNVTHGYFSGLYCDMCAPDYYGTDCKFYCIKSICNGNGFCDFNTGGCKCESRFEGTTCEKCKALYMGTNCIVRFDGSNVTLGNSLDTIVGIDLEVVGHYIKGCENVFAKSTISKLGRGVQCIYTDNGGIKRFDVFLGSNSTIKPGDKLFFDFTKFGITSTSINSTLQSAANPSISLNPVIKGPSSIYECVDVFLEGLVGGIVPDLMFSWSCPSNPVINTFINSKRMISLRIPSFLIPVGSTTFYFNVSSNLLSTNKGAVLSITKSAALFPVARILSSGVVNIEVLDSLMLEGDVFFNTTCITSLSNLYFEWTQTAGPSIDFAKMKINMESKVLEIPKGIFQSEGTYTFHFSISDGESSSSVSVDVVVTSSPLLVWVKGAKVRTLKKGSTYTLVSNVLDPSGGSDLGVTTYKWYCKNLATEGFCVAGGYVVSNSKDLMLRSEILDTFPVGNYVLNFTAVKNGRIGFYDVYIELKAADDEPVLGLLAFPSTYYVDGKKKMSIVGYRKGMEQGGKEDYYISWSIEGASKAVSPFTEENSYYYGIEENTLEPGTYKVTGVLRKRSDHSEVSRAEHSFAVNMPPRNGECTVFPTSGTATQTLFTVSCSGWKDELPILRYSYGYYSLGKKHYLKKYSSSSSFSSDLLVSGTVNLFVEVSDSFRRYSRVLLPISVSKMVITNPDNAVVYGENYFRRLWMAGKGNYFQELAVIKKACRFMIDYSSLMGMKRLNVLKKLVLGYLRVSFIQKENADTTSSITDLADILDIITSSNKTDNSTVEINFVARDIMKSLINRSFNDFESDNLNAALSSAAKMMKSSEGNKDKKYMKDIINIAKNLTRRISTDYVIIGERKSIDIGNGMYSIIIKFTKAEAYGQNISFQNMSVGVPKSPWNNVTEVDEIALIITIFPLNPYSFSEKKIESMVISVVFEVNDKSFVLKDLADSDRLEFLLPSGFSSKSMEFNLEKAGIRPACSFWDDELDQWDLNGCRRVGFDKYFVKCKCAHTTDFGSFTDHFVPEMNWLTPDDFNNITKLNEDNMTALIVVFVLTVVYLMLMVLIQLCQCCCNVAECNLYFTFVGLKASFSTFWNKKGDEKEKNRESISKESISNHNSFSIKRPNLVIEVPGKEQNIEETDDESASLLSPKKENESKHEEEKQEEEEEEEEESEISVSEIPDIVVEHVDEEYGENEMLLEGGKSVSGSDSNEEAESNSSGSSGEDKIISETNEEDLGFCDEDTDLENENIVNLKSSNSNVEVLEVEEDENIIIEAEETEEINREYSEIELDENFTIEENPNPRIDISDSAKENSNGSNSTSAADNVAAEFFQDSGPDVEKRDSGTNLVQKEEEKKEEKRNDFINPPRYIEEVIWLFLTEHKYTSLFFKGDGEFHFSTAQRLTVLYCTLLGSMFTNALTFGTESKNAMQMIATVLISNVIILPFIITFTFIFIRTKRFTFSLKKFLGGTTCCLFCFYCFGLSKLLRRKLYGKSSRKTIVVPYDPNNPIEYDSDSDSEDSYVSGNSGESQKGQKVISGGLEWRNKNAVIVDNCTGEVYIRKDLFKLQQEVGIIEDYVKEKELEEIVDKNKTVVDLAEIEEGGEELSLAPIEYESSGDAVENEEDVVDTDDNSDNSGTGEAANEDEHFAEENNDEEFVEEDDESIGTPVIRNKKSGNLLYDILLCCPKCCFYNNPITATNRLIHVIVMFMKCAMGKFTIWGFLVFLVFSIVYFIVMSGLAVLMYYELTWCGSTGTILFATLVVVFYVAVVEVMFLTARIRKFSRDKSKKWNQNQCWLVFQLIIAFFINQVSVVCGCVCFVMIFLLEGFPIEAGVAGVGFFFAISVLSLIYIIFTLKRPNKQKKKKKNELGKKALKTYIKFPFYFKFVGYILCWLFIAGMSYVIILYGIKFDTVDENSGQSEKWLTGSGLSSVEDMFIQEPIEIVFKTIVISAILRLFEVAFFRTLARSSKKKRKRRNVSN